MVSRPLRNPAGPRTITALNATGHVIPSASRIIEPSDRVRWWEKPEKLPLRPVPAHSKRPPWPGAAVGPCRRNDSALWPAHHRASLLLLHGHRVLPAPLDTATLLDARHPGRIPAPISLMTPVRGMPGLYNAPAGWHGQLTARRHGASWLVVAGGSGLAQRIEVLVHLRARIALPERSAAG